MRTRSQTQIQVNPERAKQEQIRKENEKIRRETNRKNAEKRVMEEKRRNEQAAEMMRLIPKLNIDMIDEIRKHLPLKTQNELKQLSNKSKEEKYFTLKSQNEKDKFFHNQTTSVQQQIRENEFDTWITETENSNPQGGNIIKKIFKGLTTNKILFNNSEFDKTNTKSKEYVRLTFEMDNELQEIIEKYKTTFQANIKPTNFKRLIFKYLKLKYNEYVIVYYRHITERMRKLVNEVLKEIEEEYEDDTETKIKILQNFKLEYDENNGAIWPIYITYAVSLRSDKKSEDFFRANIWREVQKKLNLEPSPARSSAASPPEDDFYD